MKHTDYLLRFDMRKLFAKGRRNLNKRVTGVQIRLPGFTFAVAPIDPEIKVARQLVVWLADKRILNSKECCDDCIDRSLASLLEIRKYIVEKQVELADLADGSLFFLMEFMAQGIRQFLTFEEELKRDYVDKTSGSLPPGFHRPVSLRERYFEALSVLRQHICLALNQVAIIAGIATPNIPDYLRVQSWKPSHYVSDTPNQELNPSAE